MSLANNNKSAHNGWLVPIFAALNFAITFVLPMAGMPVLFKEISLDLNLNLVQIGSVWGIVSFSSIFIMPIGGILCDRIGNKRALIITGLLGGLTSALRGLSNDFLSLMATTFLWGLISSAIVPATNMISSTYSSKQRQGLAQGLIAAGGASGLALGSMISATLLSPLLGGWRNVLFLYGGIAMVLSLWWMFIVKEPKRTNPADFTEVIQLRQVLIHLLRIKALWLMGLSMMAYHGCLAGMQGYLPYFLEDTGWTTAAAGGAVAAYNIVGAIGVIPMTLLSDRIGSRKICLFMSFSTAIISTGLISVVHNEILWGLVILAGIFFPLVSALFTTMCIENPQVGTTYSGTAIGLMLSVAFIGRAFAPPIGNSFASIDVNVAWPFVFWATLAVVGAIILAFIKETGSRAK